MISEEMFDLMMHMIGYGNLEDNFIDASEYNFDDTLIYELATWCDARWDTDIVGALNKATVE